MSIGNRESGKAGSFTILTTIAVIVILVAMFSMLCQARDKDTHGRWFVETNNLMNLTPVLTGEEPFILTYSFSIPLQTNIYASGSFTTLGKNTMYAELTGEGGRHASYYLRLRDNDNDVEADNVFEEADICGFTRQTNGTYQVKWNTTFARFGTHALRLELSDGSRRHRILGTTRTESVTNLVRFDPGTDSIGKWVWIHGFLRADQADYKIEVYGTNKSLLRTITGNNKSVIDEIWDLRTADGQIRKDDEFEVKVYIWPIVANNNNLTGTNTTPAPVVYPYHLYR